MRWLNLLVAAISLTACDDWPRIDAPPVSDDRSVRYTPFSPPGAFVTPVIEVDPDAPDPEETVTARAAALQARAAQLRAREM